MPVWTDEPVFALTFTNSLALVALHEGTTEKVRRLEASILAQPSSDSMLLSNAFSRSLVALSHVWDGDMYRAEATVRPALIEAERFAGRRSTVASLYAAILAAALLERDQPANAQALLAHRLDVIERVGFPDVILTAYRTLVYAALSESDERRALNVLDNLHALANTRGLPRLRMHCLAEQIRIHALRACGETVDDLVAKLEQMAPVFDEHDYLPFQVQYRLVTAIAKAYAALACHDLDSAEQLLSTADACAVLANRRRDALTVKVLRAVVAWQRNAANALPLLAEALSLASIGGISRLLQDTHPLAVQMAAQLRVTPSAAPGSWREVLDDAKPYPTTSFRSTSAASGLLTPKEAEIVGLLSQGMSNKLIARAMTVSEETVKWHIKNLFLKLSAGSRKHAVGRARLLGLIES